MRNKAKTPLKLPATLKIVLRCRRVANEVTDETKIMKLLTVKRLQIGTSKKLSTGASILIGKS